MSGERDLTRLLSGMAPVRRPGRFAFVALAEPAPAGLAVEATVREDEGWSGLVLADDARAHGLAFDVELAWLTLTVHSDLEAVGLTAAVSAALTAEGIPANVVAGLRHDHVLVPEFLAEHALEALAALTGA